MQRLNVFDKVCAVLAFIVAVVFVALGALGLFLGSSAHFTLPPVLGGLPALVGWGIVKPVIVAWRQQPMRIAVSLSADGQIKPFPNDWALLRTEQFHLWPPRAIQVPLPPRR